MLANFNSIQQIRVLITGGAGFIGKAVVRHFLEKGYEVFAIARNENDIQFNSSRLTWRIGDIRDSNFMDSVCQNIDYAIHLAAAKADESDSYQINVDGTSNLLKAALKNNVKGILNISTVSTKLPRSGIYAKTKAQADDLLINGSLPVIILKPSIVYGDKEAGIFGTIVKYAKLRLVPVFGNGRFSSRPIHVSDIAVAIEKIIKKGFNDKEIYEIGGPDVISFNELVQKISQSVYGRPAVLVHIPAWIGLGMAYIFKYIFKKPPLTASNVLAMFQDVSVNPEEFNAAYNFTPRTLNQGLLSLSTDIQLNANK